MKKILFVLVLITFFASFIYAQEDADKEITLSKTAEFSKKNGTFIKKEFQKIGSIDDVSFTNIYFKDLLTNEKISALRLQTSYVSSGDYSYYKGILDSDELDVCIKCFNYIKDNCIGPPSEFYTEIFYNSRDGVSIGAFYENNKKHEWTIFVKTESYTNHSLKKIKQENLPDLISLFTSAKNAMIE